ncbi:MAG: hypothetical protein J6C13_04870 [Clostridia bacterium]|nr:hypothetical protein [Clostridia bacterium]
MQNNQKTAQKSKSSLEKDLVREIKKDFEQRQEERKPFDAQWQLNLNFVMGNQYCGIGVNDTLDDFDKQYFWQEREVYNHIAPLVDTRLSKLAKVRPTMTVLPASSEQDDVSNAHICKDILQSVASKIELSELVSQATRWSEICGTSFYKIVWNDSAGSVVGLTTLGERIYEGDVDVIVCSPFEIYPDSNTAESLDCCQSIIHARAYDINTIKRHWGVDVEGEDIDTYNLQNSQVAGGLGYTSRSGKVSKTVKHNHAMVIERYEMPNKKYPNGRLVIIAGDKLLYDGELPYKNLQNGERGFPFIRQISIGQPSMFWGTSIVERCIPVQRAYNAVKNRKHEFMNRLCMGVMSVEDGSVDIDNLEEEGLSPGKVLIYRQGARAPQMLSTSSLPVDFRDEEDKLINEFTNISGVSDIFGSNAASLSNLSGVALQLLVEQEDMRVSASGEYIKFAMKEIGRQILRLYKQFITTQRINKLVGENGTSKLFYWDSSQITSDDVTFETESELGETVAQKRNMVFDLYKAGLLHDENGKLSNSMRLKVMEMLGFGVWEDALDNNNLQIEKAKRENIDFIDNKTPEVLEIHDHDLHINTHTAFMLSADFEKACQKSKNLRQKMLEHVRMHKKFKKLSILAENNINTTKN